MKKILSLIISLAMFLSLSITTFASDALAVAQPESVSQENTSNPFISPEAYIKYLESFGNEYSEFLSQFKTLSPEKQQTILDVLSNGGTLDVKLSEPIVTTPCFYSVSAVILRGLGGAQLGTVAFMTNVLRELMAFLMIPFVARHFGRYAAVAPSGATAMDTTLPVIARATDDETALIAVISGVVLTALVPVLVPLLYNLL